MTIADAWRGNGRPIALIAPAFLVLLFAFAYPVVWLLAQSVTTPTFGLQNYVEIFQRSIYLRVIWNTLSIGGLVTLGCVLIGYPYAYTMVKSTPGVRRLLIFIVLIPFWTSILVRSFAWLVILQRQGLVNEWLMAMGAIGEPLALVHNRTGVLIGMIQIMLPFLIFPLYSVMSSIDETYTKAASSLGARPIRNFFRIYLPLSMPGLLAGAMLVFIISIGYFITPVLLGGRRDVMISQLIESQVADFGNWGFAGALAVVLIVMAAICLLIAKRLTGGQSFDLQ